jgi:hypothetical protein
LSIRSFGLVLGDEDNLVVEKRQELTLASVLRERSPVLPATSARMNAKPSAVSAAIHPGLR